MFPFSCLRADDSIDKILGLELGADDYVTKPFDSREVVAVFEQYCRTTGNSSTSMVFDGGRVRIHLASQSVETGQPVALTPTEFDLLVHLARHPSRVLPGSSC